jgi:hypothetical protein
MSTETDFQASLHRIHAVPSKGNSFDLARCRWRPEGDGSMADKAAVAYRLTLCWNLMEGIPNQALDAGCVSTFHAAVDALLEAVETLERYSGTPSTLLVQRRAEELRAALAAFNLDTRNGRLHDCPGCLGEEAALPATEDGEEPPVTPSSAPATGQGDLFG